MKIRYSKIAEIIICKSVIETDNVCNKTNFLFCFVSDALFIAGMRTVLVGMVVIKILNALAMGASKNLKDRVPNPTLKSSMPPNKKEVKSRVIYSISQISFYEQPKKGRNHRS